jgi:hypothetical protein
MKEGQIQNKSAVRKFFESLKDGKYLLEADNSNKRTSPQNRYYWGCVIPILTGAFRDLGHELTNQEVHSFLKGKFNTISIINETTGEFIDMPRSTAGLNKEDFGYYIESIQRWAAEFLSVVIPDPNEQMKIDL